MIDVEDVPLWAKIALAFATTTSVAVPVSLLLNRSLVHGILMGLAMGIGLSVVFYGEWTDG